MASEKTGMCVIRHEEPGKQKSPQMSKKEMILLLLSVEGAFGRASEKPQYMQFWAFW